MIAWLWLFAACGEADVTDADGDGYSPPADCNDQDASVHPGAGEDAYDGIDRDCDGASDADADGDGFDAAGHGGEDCQDDDAAVFPGSAETCNGEDDDCDGHVDEVPASAGGWYLDGDGDGYGDAASPLEACVGGPGVVSDASDCDDSDAGVNPDAAEVCGDGTDNDCDGALGRCEASRSLALAGATVSGDAAGQGVGWSALSPGDLDRDGAADLVVGGAGGTAWFFGAPLTGDRDVGSASGAVTTGGVEPVTLGAGDAGGSPGPELLVGAADLSTAWLLDGVPAGSGAVDDEAVVTFLGAAGERLGGAFTLGSDLTGDGVPDFALGAPGDVYALAVGRVRVVAGPQAGVVVADQEASLTVDGRIGATFSDGTGTVLASADVDGDGVGDLATGGPLGAVQGDPAEPWGRAYLFYGPLGDANVNDADALLDSDGPKQAGGSLAFPGDLDGDGLPELAVAGFDPHLTDANPTEPGTVWILSRPLGNLALAGAEAVLVGEAAGDRAGETLGAPGDVTGDGRDDLLVGAPGWDGHGFASDSGAAYLLVGPLEGAIPLADGDVRLEAPQAGDLAHPGLAGGQDLTGDGVADVVVGAAGRDLLAREAGTVSLLSGGLLP